MRLLEWSGRSAKMKAVSISWSLLTVLRHCRHGQTTTSKLTLHKCPETVSWPRCVPQTVQGDGVRCVRSEINNTETLFRANMGYCTLNIIISECKLINKFEYQTTQNKIQNLNKLHRYRYQIIELWIPLLVLIEAERFYYNLSM